MEKDWRLWVHRKSILKTKNQGPACFWCTLHILWPATAVTESLQAVSSPSSLSGIRMSKIAVMTHHNKTINFRLRNCHAMAKNNIINIILKSRLMHTELQNKMKYPNLNLLPNQTPGPPAKKMPNSSLRNISQTCLSIKLSFSVLKWKAM